MLTDNQLQKVNSLQAKARVIGIAGLVVGAIGGAVMMLLFGAGLKGLFQPFLVAYLLILGLGVSSLAAVMLHHLCGGAWSYMIQRICEAGARTLPFLAVVGAVVILGGMFLTDIYPWRNAEYLHAHHIVELKTPFLNATVFTLCSLLYFGVWLILSFLYNKWSRDLDATGDVNIIGRMRALAAPGLILYVLTMTFAATHWAMSLEAVWFSTIYGAWMMAGYALSVVAFATIVLSYLSEEGILAEKVTTRHYHHLGTFLCGFTIFWTYCSFSQFLIIWHGNLPEEIGWYLNRSGSAWLNLFTVFMCVTAWFIPMIYTFFRRNKTFVPRLRFIAFWILGTRILDMYWNIVPSWPGHQSTFNPLMFIFVVAAVFGLGGIWLSIYLGELKKLPLLPQNDPRGELFFLKDIHSHA